MSGGSSGLSDQTKKLLLGATVATAAAGIGYLTLKSLKIGENKDDLKTQLEKIKAAGNLLFKDKNYVGAAKKFSQGIAVGEEGQEEKGLLAMLYQNRAACREKIGETAFDVLNDCLAAIKNDKNYAKAYLRASKQLNTIGKKPDALTYLLAAFTLDQRLNQSNFAFFEDLLTVDLTQTHIPTVPGIFDRKPLPVSLFRIQQWWDTWDVQDLFKLDAESFVPKPDDEEELLYRKALDQIKAGQFEEVAETLKNEDILYPPAQILRAKFMNYSIQPSAAAEYADNFGTITTLEGIDTAQRRDLVLEAFQILKLELCLTVDELERFLSETAPDHKRKERYRLCTFASLLTFNGCVLDLTASTHEEQMLADMKNTAKLLHMSAECDTLPPHLKMLQLFVSLCSTGEHSRIIAVIREMEECFASRPTHFNILLMAKVYMMTGNTPSAQRLFEQAARSTNCRYLVSARYVLEADSHLQKPDDERLAEVTRCTNSAFEVDEFNFSAHILLLLGRNGPEPTITQENYDLAMNHLLRAAVFAPPRELMMIKRMYPLLEAKKRASQLLGVF